MFFIDFVGSLLIWSLGFALADWGCVYSCLAERPNLSLNMIEPNCLNEYDCLLIQLKLIMFWS